MEEGGKEGDRRRERTAMKQRSQHATDMDLWLGNMETLQKLGKGEEQILAKNAAC